MKVDEAIEEMRPVLANRKGIIFHNDNARLHTSLVTRVKLLNLGSEVKSHPLNSPDLTRSNYLALGSVFVS